MAIDSTDAQQGLNLWGHRGRLLLTGLLALLAFAWAAHWFMGRQQQAQASDPGPSRGRVAATVPVGVETTTQGDFPVYLTGLGTVTALHTVTVRARVDGELVRVAFTEGQMVRQGDLLVEIDPRPFQVQLHQAEGQLARDEALLKNAELDLARYKTLLEQDSIAAQQTVTQESLVRQHRGTVEVDRAQVENAQLQLSYARITAPVSGRIGLRLVDKGNIVHAGDTNGLVVITQIQPIAVVFTLPEDDLPKVMDRWREGQGIAVDAYDRGGKSKLAAGQLLAVDNQIDPTTGTVKLKAQFGNEDGRLFSNQFVNVRMRLDVLKAAIIVPSAAIQRGSQGDFAYVLKDDQTVSVRPLELGPVEGERTVILNGLAPGDRVVVDGVDKLREGTAVEVISREVGKPPTVPEVLPESKPGRRAAGQGAPK
jgi:membrane fusion protein, multidrug efflux system